MWKDFGASRKLIWKLARNDFKTRYAGSYFGVLWAMVQPVIIVLVYWLSLIHIWTDVSSVRWHIPRDAAPQ